MTAENVLVYIWAYTYCIEIRVEIPKNQQLPTRVPAEILKREILGESILFRDAILSHKQKQMNTNYSVIYLITNLIW